MQQYTPTSSSKPTFESSFPVFFNSLPIKPNTIRLFERGGYYSIHGKEAIFACKIVFNTQTVMKKWDNLDYITLTMLQYESFIRKSLCEHGTCVEVYSKAGSSGWKCTKEGSPGSIGAFEEEMWFGDGSESMICSTVVMALTEEKGQIGVALIDSTLRKCWIGHYMDNDGYTITESLIIQMNVKEIVYPSGTLEVFRNLILQRTSIVLTAKKKFDFYIPDLKKLIREEDHIFFTQDLPNTFSCLGCLFEYLNINDVIFSLLPIDLTQSLKLDVAAVHALHLVPDHQAGISLYDLLNHCQTQQGSRLLLQCIRQPLIDKNEIEKRLDLVQFFVKSTNQHEMIRSQGLKTVPDLLRIQRKLSRNSANLQDILRLYQVTKNNLYILQDCLEGQEIKKEFIEPLDEMISSLIPFNDLVESTIDLEKADHHEYVVKSSFDESLMEITERKKELESIIQPEFINVANDLGLEPHKKIKLEHNSIYGHYFRVTRNDASVLVGTRYIELATQKNGIYFCTVKVKEANEALVELSNEYKTKQREFVREIIRIVSTFDPVWTKLNNWIAMLDLVNSFAHQVLCSSSPYVRPNICPLGQGDLILTNSRHPCLETVETFISNNVEFIRDSSMFHIITGCNRNGKSTLIRQTALIVLMAQIGCFVPCDQATIPIVDSIMSRVGANDCQLKGISTFMAEMLETASILKTATPNSLIIIDELGRGTSTVDGFGLAWAISEYIAKEIKCFCFFATHFHELTVLANEIPIVKNYHMTVYTGDNSLTLLFKLKPGVADQSFGIHVAEMAEFPPLVTRLAKSKLKWMDETDKKKTKIASDLLQVSFDGVYEIGFDKTVDRSIGLIKSNDFIMDLVGQ